MSRRNTASLLLILPLLIAAGCGGGTDGPERFPVTGKVTINGEPLDDGSIQFIPEAGTDGPSSGAPITNGAYTIPAEKGPVAGQYLVQIRGTKKTGKQIEAGPPNPPGTMVDEVVQAVPAEYNSNSTLKATIKEGPNEDVNFQLENAALNP